MSCWPRGDIGKLVDDDRKSRIDRMVMYATVECREAFTLTHTHEAIQAVGVNVPIDELRESFARLTLAYVLQKRHGAYVYPVPLIRDVLRADSDHDPQRALAMEAQAFLAAKHG